MKRRFSIGVLASFAIVVQASAQNSPVSPPALTRAQGQLMMNALCASQSKLCREPIGNLLPQPGGKPGTVHPFVVGIGATFAPGITINPFVVGPGTAPAPGSINSGIVAATLQPVPASPGSFAYDDPIDSVVAITFNVAGVGQICTGTLLDPDHVLTAGHCGCGDPTSYQVHFAATYSDGLSIGSKAPVLFDPRICGSTQYAGHDLAVLELKSSIPCPPALPIWHQGSIDNNAAGGAQAGGILADCRSAPLRANLTAPATTFGFPAADFWDIQPKLQIGKKLTVVGYGYTNSGGIGLRMQDSIPIASVACTEPRLASVCAPYAEMILAEAIGPTLRDDTCEGDSGGPVFLMEDGGYTLVAVTSRAAPGVQDDPVHHCGGGGIYGLIGRNSVHGWLQSNGIQAATTKVPQ